MTDNVDGYSAWVGFCNDQNWSFQSQIIILEGFLNEHDLISAFVEYAREIADMGNLFKQ
jgi:hypothetical protein